MNQIPSLSELQIAQKSINFSELITSSNTTLSLQIQDRLVERLNTSFTEDEQRWYVANLYMYMNYNSTDDYPINLEDVFPMIGFANKENAKRTLKNNFTENEDYKKLLVHTDEQKNGENRGGHNKETVMLNVDTFKNLCMLAKTDQGKKIRKYYVKLENVYNELVKDEICQKQLEIQKQKELLEKETKQLQDSLEQTQQELVKYKEKTYEAIEKTGHIYVIKTDAQGSYKVGKTKDAVNKRIRGLQTGNVNNIEILLDFKTSNPDLLENCAHYILDRYRCNSNREFFDCDPEYIKSIITVVGSTIDTLKSCYKHISNDELTSRLESGVKFTINDNINDNISDNINDRPPEYNAENVNFYNWLDKNIVKRHNSLLHLKDVCESYLDTKKIHSRLSHRIRIDLESWIRRRFDNIKCIYTDSSLNGIRYKGWVGLDLAVYTSLPSNNSLGL